CARQGDGYYTNYFDYW
nr:immunoglobulin heavy chain junction region [Mus musculus]MBK4189037.1 immunoglobulin heavy chain junction region [Mus musculus]